MARMFAPLVMVLFCFAVVQGQAQFEISPDISQNQFVGTTQQYTISVMSFYYRVTVEFPTSTKYLFVPTSVTFGVDDLSKNFTLRADTPDFLSITLTVTGDDAIYYGSPTIYKNVVLRSLSFTGGYATFPVTNPVLRVPTNPFTLYPNFYPANGATLTVKSDPAGAVTVYPDTFLFTATETRPTFHYEASWSGPVVLMFTWSGPDGLYYAPLNQSIFPIKRTIVGSPAYTSLVSPTVNVESQAVRVSLNYPPPTGLTLTPHSDSVKFNPESLGFTPDVDSVQFTYSGSKAGAQVVYWTLGGDDKDLYSDFPNKTFVINARTFVVTAPSKMSYKVGQASDVFTVSTQYPPENGVDINLSINDYGSCGFGGKPEVNPKVISFTSSILEVSFTVTSPVTCVSLSIVGELSGTDKDAYAPPYFGSVLEYGKLFVSAPVNTDPAWTGVLYCGETTSYTLSVTTPPPTGFSVSLSAEGASFSPSKLDFTNTVTTLPFSVTSTYLQGSILVKFTVSGTDVPLLANIPDRTISVGSKTVTPAAGYQFTTPDTGVLYAGTTSSPVTIDLSRPPTTDITVTPYAQGLTFEPPAITFSSLDKSKPFVVTAVEPGTYTITYTLSGTDAGCYSLDYSTTSVTVAKLFAKISPSSMQPLAIGVLSQVFTITIDNLPSDVTVTPVAYDINGFVVPTYTFQPDTLTLTKAKPSASFQYISSTRRPTSDRIRFEFSGAIEVAILSVQVGSSQSRTFTTPTHLIGVSSGTFLAAMFVVGIQSPEFVVTVDDAPPTKVVLRPSAPGTVFEPETLEFTSTTKSATFKLTTLDGTGTTVGTGTLKDISWKVEGDDASIYAAPADNSFYALQRSLKIASVNTLTDYDVFVDAPIPFTIATPYAPETDLIFTPVSDAFSFDPSPIVLVAGTTSITFAATPTKPGIDNMFSFTTSGNHAVYYVELPNVYVTTQKSDFQVITPVPPAGSNVQLTVGYPSFAFTVRTRTPPKSSVTLTIYSQQVTFDTPSFTFTPTETSHDFYIEPIISAFPQFTNPSVAFEFVVSGENAEDFNTPADVSFVASVSTPLRTLEVGPTTGFNLGTGKTVYFTVRSPVPALSSVTITPFVAVDGYKFTPASAVLTDKVTTVTFGVQRLNTALPKYTTAIVVLGVTGDDAYLFADPPVVYIYPVSGSVTNNGIYDNFVATVNQKTTFAISLTEPPSDILTITPKVLTGQPVTFDPATITFNPGQLSTTYSIIPNGVGKSRIGFVLGGGAAVSFTPLDDKEISIIPGTITFSNSWNFAIAGTEIKGTVTLNTPVSKALTITPTAAGLTFTPPTISFTAGSTLASFSVKADANSINGPITLSLGGEDGTSGLYTNPMPTLGYQGFAVGTGTVSFSITNSAGSYMKQTITVTISTGVRIPSLIVTPSGDGLTFMPSTVTFSSPTVTSQTIDVYGSAPSAANIQFALSGDGAKYFTIATNFYTNPITARFYAYPIYVNSPINPNTGLVNVAPVGTVSLPFTISTEPLVSAIQTVYITPKANLPDVEFFPSTMYLNSSSTVASFTYRSNTTVGNIIVSYEVSGPGAASFLPIAATTFTVPKITFTLPRYDNTRFMTPSNGPFVYGIRTPVYSFFVRYAPVPVSVTLISDSFAFSPSTFIFSPKVFSAQFSMIPTKVGSGTIQYLVNDTTYFSAPSPTTGVWVTYRVKFPQIPTLNVGAVSPSQEVSIEPAPVTPFQLTLTTQNADGLVFSPSKLVFGPGETKQWFTVFPTQPTIGRASGYNIPGSLGGITTGSSSAIIYLAGVDGGDASGTERSVPLTEAAGIIVAPATFKITHPRYQLDVESMIEVSISLEPRSDVVITLLANNLHMDKPYLIFTRGGPTTQQIMVTPVHTTSYELAYTPFKVDYYVSGTNANDYLAPSESLHYFAIPMGYIAAIILVPIAVIVIIVIIFIALKKKGSK